MVFRSSLTGAARACPFDKLRASSERSEGMVALPGGGLNDLRRPAVTPRRAGGAAAARGAGVDWLGLEALGDGRAIVRHIAVDAKCRRQGVGREAVGFYERCGFAMRSLGEVHLTDRFPSAERFHCTLGQPPT